MRIGVRFGPFSVSTSTRGGRRRSRSRRPSWHATGHATTPDGREVDFRCHHSHRSQSAALSCASTVRKQIEHGQSLHLITRVRSTPASREAARQRARQQEARRQAREAQHAEQREASAQRRAQQRQAQAVRQQQRALEKEARRQAGEARRAEQREASAQQKEALAVRQQRQTAEEQAQRAYAAQEHAAWKEEAARQHAERMSRIHQGHAERMADIHDRSEQRRERVRQTQAERSQRRRAHGWPATGLMIAGAATLLGVILAGVASPRSSLGAVAGGLILLGVLAAFVCATAALWRRLRRGHQEREGANAGANNDPGRSWMVVDQMTHLGATEQARMSGVDARGQPSFDS